MLLKLTWRSVGQLQKPGSSDQIWKTRTSYVFWPTVSPASAEEVERARHLAASGRKYSTKKASSVLRMLSLKMGSSHEDRNSQSVSSPVMLSGTASS